LYLLFDEQNSVHEEDVLFTTEGHIIPLEFLRGLKPVQVISDSERQKTERKGSFQFTKPDSNQKKPQGENTNNKNKNNNKNSNNVEKENYLQCSAIPLDYTPINRHANPFLNPLPLTQSKPKPQQQPQQQPQSQQQQTLETLLSKATNVVGLPPGIQIKLVGGLENLNNVNIKDLNAMIQSNEITTPQTHMLAVLEILSPSSIRRTFLASPATFGPPLNLEGFEGQLALANPLNACLPLTNPSEVKGKIVLVERGVCMFGEKARNIMSYGGIGVIVADHGDNSEVFVMTDSLDQKVPVTIPSILITNKHSKILRAYLEDLKNSDYLQSDDTEINKEKIGRVMIDENHECFKDTHDNVICQPIDPLEIEKQQQHNHPGIRVKLRTMKDEELGELLQKAKEEKTHKYLFESFAVDELTDVSNPEVLDKILEANKLTTANPLSEIAIEFDPTLFPGLLKITQNQGSISQEKMIRDLLAQLGGMKIGSNPNQSVIEKEKPQQKVRIEEDTNSDIEESESDDENEEED